MYEASKKVMPEEAPPLVYPALFETGLVSKNSGIRWNSQWAAVSQTCAGLHAGLEQVDHGLWDVYLGPVKLGRLLEEKLRIEDHLGRLKRKKVLPMSMVFHRVRLTVASTGAREAGFVWFL